MTSRPIRPRNQQPVRTQSQNFRPQADWRDEEKSTILLVYLPGFLKEQVRTTYDASARSIRLYGERRLPNNRRIRIDERYNVPENCEGSKLETQLGRGILMISFPKVKPAPVPEPEEAARKPEETANGVKTQKVEEETVSVGNGKQVDGEETSPKKTSSVQIAEQHETPAQAVSSADSENQTNEANLGQEKAKKEVIKEPAVPEMAVPRAVEGEKEKISEKSCNLSADSKMKGDVLKPGGDSGERKAIEKIIPGLKMELNELGNPLTNTVVAALVIMGVGACFFYSLGP